jgi:hypothetical protein
MISQALRLTEEEGLLFANAVAGKYVSNAQRVYPTISDIVEFMTDLTLRLKPVRLPRNYD